MRNNLDTVTEVLLMLAAITTVLLMLLLSGAGCLTGPSGVTSALDVSPWWPEAEKRLLIWLEANPQCPPNYVNPLGRVKIKVDVMSADKPCIYHSSGVIVYDERWLDGCMAHELGHAALEMAGNSCWRDYEHDTFALDTR